MMIFEGGGALPVVPDGGGRSSFVIVQVNTSPAFMVPEHPERLVSYNSPIVSALTLKKPGSSVIEVPGEPVPVIGNVFGEGFVPVTLISKSDDCATPPLSFTTCVITRSVPYTGGGAGGVAVSAGHTFLPIASNIAGMSEELGEI